MKYLKPLLPVISAILFSLSFWNGVSSILAWVALVPLLCFLDGADLKARFIAGYVFGLVFFGSTIYWLINVSVPGMVALVMILGVFPAIFCLFPAGNRPFDIVMVPALWVITEFIRAHIFTGFPWALAGHSQYLNLPVIQIADVTGAYGVSFMVVMANTGVYSAVKNGRKGIGHIISLLIFLTAVYYYGFATLKAKPADRKLNIAVVQGNIPQEMKWEAEYRDSIIEKYISLSSAVLKEKPDIIIWPETSVPGYVDIEEDIRERLENLAGENDVSLLAGAVRYDGSRYYNSAYLFSDDGEISGVYSKVHLVPFGEFIPFEEHLTWFRGMIDKPIGDFAPGSDYTLFPIRKTIRRETSEGIEKDTWFYKFGVMICFEDIFPEIAREMVKKGADILVNITNDAWFGRTKAPYQHLQSSVFRAVENRVPVVRAANTGISCFISHQGKVLDAVRAGGEMIFIEGSKAYEISVPGGRSTYTFTGDIFCAICALLFFGAGILRRFNVPV